ncbi:aromatic prenyltransferase [Exidia glandulosa HHB12029]|uniref:Aromatic prenyltransferase n=1 Tax=Exidia glandulosa HHB12029 TaxID=1314781 RepID=A0A165KVT2_EXIGL|nr:aromatic prenyltransferase [Exidia glandulosa HHB12029]
MPAITITPPACQWDMKSYLDDDASYWYNVFKPMLEKLLHHSRYSQARCNDVLAFFASNMVPFLGPAPTGKLAARRWRSFMTPDNTPMEPSLAWSASCPAPRTRLAIDIIPAVNDSPDATAKRSIDFAGALRQYMDGPNTVAITNLDLEAFYAVAEQLFIPVLHNPSAHELIDDLVSGPSMTFFGIDIEEESTKVKAYFIPELAARSLDEDVLVTMSRTFMALVPEDPALRATLGEFAAWREIVSSFSTLPEEDIPLPFILSVDCVPRLEARYKVYFRCRCRTPEELTRIMSLDGKVELSPRHVQGVIDLWNLLRPNTRQLDSQTLLAESGLCIYYDFKQSSRFPAVKVYLPVQNWASNDLKIARAIATWLETYGHPESARTYVDFASDLCSHRRLVEASGFHTYVGIAPKAGGCEATTYYNLSLFRQEPSFASGSTPRLVPSPLP